MSWGTSVILRLVALMLGLFFVWCEARGTYEFLLKDQDNQVNYIVQAGTGFAVAFSLLPMFASQLFERSQYPKFIACWLAMPIVVGVVFYAAIQRTGGAADQAQINREIADNNGTLASKNESDANDAWKEARAAAVDECNSGRGKKCLDAEAKRDKAWERLQKARGELKNASDKHPDPGASRVVALLPARFSITEDQVRLYQPMLIPLGMSVLAALFLNIGMSMKTPPMPRPWRNWQGWQNWRKAEPSTPQMGTPGADTLPAIPDNAPITAPVIDITPKTEPAPLPESKRLPARQRQRLAVIKQEPKPEPVEESQQAADQDVIDPNPVIKFLVERVPKAEGEDADWADILRELPGWWVEQGIDGEPPTPAQLGAVLRFVSEKAGMRTRRRDGKVFFADRKVIRLVAKEQTA
jgi:hypothetical protein